MQSIRLCDVTFGHSDASPLFSAVSIDIARGMTGVVGRNGCGKSTFLHLISGALTPAIGRVVRPPHALIHYAPQLDRVFDSLTHEARSADILLLDEPTNGHDRLSTDRLARRLKAFRGIALVVSHDRQLLDAITTRTIRIANGRAQMFDGPYSKARETWRLDEEAQRERYRLAKRARATVASSLESLRGEQSSADSARSKASRLKSPQDSDGREAGRKGAAYAAEAKWSRRVATTRGKLERSLQQKSTELPVFIAQSPKIAFRTIDSPTPIVFCHTGVVIARGDRVLITGRAAIGKTGFIQALVRSCRIPFDQLLYNSARAKRTGTG